MIRVHYGSLWTGHLYHGHYVQFSGMNIVVVKNSETSDEM